MFDSLRRVWFVRISLNLLAVGGLLIAITASAQELGTNDFRISFTETGFLPLVAYNGIENEFMVIWRVRDDGDWIGVHGRRIDGDTGAFVGQQFTVFPGATGCVSMAFNSKDNEYLVVFSAVVSIGGAQKAGIFGHRVAVDGSPIGELQLVSAPETPTPNPQLHDLGIHPSLAYNSQNNEYFVAWSGFIPDEVNPAHFDGAIVGRVVDENGTVVTPRLILSSTIADGQPDKNDWPDVAYNRLDNEYLVVWSAVEIHGQRVMADGSEIGEDNLTISSTVGGFSQSPAVEHNHTNNHYLVVWRGAEDDPPHTNSEGRMIDGQDGSLMGDSQFFVSNFKRSDSRVLWSMTRDIAYNETENEFLVAWWSRESAFEETFEIEIASQRIDTEGNQIGADDFQISDVGPDGDLDFEASEPGIAYNPQNEEYLVVWQETIRGPRLRMIRSSRCSANATPFFLSTSSAS